ncbi:hypothetical protein GCM10011506_46720 [Marivirga lumbricoides]|uniref:ER-bound oxygenase mpaB/mpaB'/Rubber oxygenase catalytic domain-containing protein n=1 Tax=Marivirga lumbricoides TaxID=1046115 RepID=A0ABQ1N6Q3_9BACT|nr:hypothetical protein GCM10011506_46720 [Marivirga lumbricoides]
MRNQFFNISTITPNFLNSCRFETDQLADQVIAKIIEQRDLNHLNEIFLTLVKNDSFNDSTFSSFPASINKLLQNYFQVSSELPQWYNAEKVQVGEQVFSEFGPEIFMLLNVSSLPMCYTCAKGAQVLYDTGRLLSHKNDIDPLARRLMETGQMIFNVLSSGGLSPGGRGIITVQKVRLIHAAIRYYLKHGAERNGFTWDVEELGEPINQEDLAGTLMSFGPVILNGLKKLGIELSDDQIEGYMHCWRVVGHLMGIKEALLPESYDESFQLANKILAHQSASSQAGIALTDSCIKFIQSVVKEDYLDDLPAYLMNYFLEDFSKASGHDLASYINVKSSHKLKDLLVLKFMRFFSHEAGALEHHSLVQKISKTFNKKLLRGIISHYNDDKSVRFSIPPSLTKDWNL